MNKPLPPGTAFEPTKWEDLEPLDRARALQWMLNGLDLQTKKKIEGAAYRHLCYCVTKGVEFDPVSVWRGLAARMQDHFAHSRKAYEAITKLIDLEAGKIVQANIKKVAEEIELMDDDDDQEGIYDEQE